MNNLFQIREISTLSFNERVLQEAEDKRNPLMERLRFLGIFSSNMDEFFKVRVASIHRRLELGKKGMAEVLEVIGDKTRELDERFREAYAEIVSALENEGIKILTEQDLTQQSQELQHWVNDYFRANVMPFAVPILIRDGQPFPSLKDGAVYFAVKMWGEKTRYAILEIPPEVPRFVQLPNGNIMYVDDVIRYALDQIFYIFEYERIEAYEIKISRDAELDIDNDFSEGYVRKMERVLKQRKGGRPTRLVYDATMPPGLLKVLQKELKIIADDTLIPGGRYHNMKDLMRFPNPRPDLAYPKVNPVPHPVLDSNLRVPMMDIIRKQDIMVTYPYQSFDHVVRLLREAAIDPKVEEIKMTMYRAAQRSQIVNALANAARNGKRVFVSIELQARFDEQHNIKISEFLTESGAQVCYGVPPMKTHAKLMLIKRRGGSIAGFSTGNFNESTGKLYVDCMLFTADKRLTEEAEGVFEFLDRASKMHTVSEPKFKHLMVSPFTARRMITKFIAREKEKGPDGYICMKVNHLTDTKIIDKIREAADAGVQMHLIVRTTYAMLPHPNIRAISILDRYLEHQRIFIFGRGENRRVYMSSSDLMERNLDWRVEVAFPIYDPHLMQEVVDVVALQVADTYKARELDEFQANKYVVNGSGAHQAQVETYQYYRDLAERAVSSAADDHSRN
ncbi:MAG TPA: polyphosphate kinase 1 [Candidatus Hydrogenedentes bacterium]|nr:polyphosphate kinase 1 [Candidatus Hydrogenedentota bacterium]